MAATKLNSKSPVVDESPAFGAPTELSSTLDSQLDIASLKAQRAALDAQIKAASPKLTQLEKVIAHQASIFNKWIGANLASRTRDRIKAGQDRHLALAAVVEFYLAKTNELLDSQPEG